MGFPTVQFEDAAQRARFHELVTEIQGSGKSALNQRAALEQLFSAAQAVDVIDPNGRIDGGEGKVLLGAVETYRSGLSRPLDANYGTRSEYVPGYYAYPSHYRPSHWIEGRTVNRPGLAELARQNAAAAKRQADENAAVRDLHIEANAAIK